MTKYEYLMEKSERCINHARHCESEWARKFWVDVGHKLEELAKGMSVQKAGEKK